MTKFRILSSSNSTKLDLSTEVKKKTSSVKSSFSKESWYPFIGPIRPRPYKVTFFCQILALRTRDGIFGVCTYLLSGDFIAAEKWISSGSNIPYTAGTIRESNH